MKENVNLGDINISNEDLENIKKDMQRIKKRAFR